MYTWFKYAWLGRLQVFTAYQTTGHSKDMTEITIAEGTNRSFSHTVTTEAQANTVWQLWTDVSTWKEWDEGLKGAEMSGPFVLQAQGRIIPLSGPSSRFEVTELTEGQSYSFETRLPFARLTVRRLFVAHAPTVFRHEVSFSGALASFWAGRFGPGFRVALPPTMDTLAKLAQAQAAQ